MTLVSFTSPSWNPTPSFVSFFSSSKPPALAQHFTSFRYQIPSFTPFFLSYFSFSFFFLSHTVCSISSIKPKLLHTVIYLYCTFMKHYKITYLLYVDFLFYLFDAFNYMGSSLNHWNVGPFGIIWWSVYRLHAKRVKKLVRAYSENHIVYICKKFIFSFLSNWFCNYEP